MWQSRNVGTPITDPDTHKKEVMDFDQYLESNTLDMQVCPNLKNGVQFKCHTFKDKFTINVLLR